MLILAIDTTGFSASIALVRDGKEVLFNKISSGYVSDKHWKDFPYILPAHHQRFLIDNLEKTLKQKKISWKNIDAIAVSANSGIYTCILVGVSVAYTLGKIYKKPVIEIDHILAHLYSTWLEKNPENLRFPILVFSASGSHSDFSLLKSKKKCRVIYDTVPRQDKGEIKIFIGIGKIFYQMGKRLGIITSADSGVSKLMKAISQGDPYKFNFAKYYQEPVLDLNFSDFINSIDVFLKKQEKKSVKLSSQFIKDVAASFQESINEVLSNKIIKIAKIKKAKEIHITGGISENKHLEKRLKGKIKKGRLSFVLRYPVKKGYRLDNAAMIGCLAYYQKKYNIKFTNFKPSITK